MSSHKAIIIGGGITGVAAALALTKHNDMSCSIFEIRSAPATIGGAIGLTPKALRYLDHLGVLHRLQSQGCEVKGIDIMSHRTGKQLGAIDFDNVDKFKHRGLRIMRHQLLEAMLETLKELGVRVRYGMKIDSVVEGKDTITAIFEDGTKVQGDMLLGCDGIHSAVRTKFVQPDRRTEYTGIASAYCFVDAAGLRDQLPIDTTSLYFSRFGSLLLSYIDPAKSRLYVAAVMRAEDFGSRDGWTVRGQDQKALKDDLLRRFSTLTLPFIDEVLQRVDNITLYPVHRLSDNGVWSSGCTLLLGDAAHAMPPQGESAGLALEDAILLSQIFEHRDKSSIAKLFQHYNDLRRDPINAAVKEANFGFETIQDRGWLGAIIMEWASWAVLKWRASRKEEEFAFDVRDVALNS